MPITRVKSRSRRSGPASSPTPIWIGRCQARVAEPFKIDDALVDDPTEGVVRDILVQRGDHFPVERDALVDPGA